MSLREQRLARIATAKGVDWFPSWARTPVDYFSVGMPRETAARELRFVAGLGLDHVRIWLSAWGWERDKDAWIENLAHVLDVADELGLGVVLELFDSCGTEPGELIADGITRVEDVPALGEGTPSLAVVNGGFASRGRDIFEAPGLAEIPWRGDSLAAIWEGFVPNPGYHWLGKEHWPRWDAFATDVVGLVAKHPAVWLLEVMNEPFITQLGHEVDQSPIVAFYHHVIELVRGLDPELPLAIGAAQPWMREHDANAPDLDVISFHSLSGADAMREALATAEDIGRGRPLYLSEWGYFPGGSDQAQLDEYKELLPIIEAAGIGWAVTHLIAGYGPFANTAILYPSGVMRPAALWLRRHLQTSVVGA